MGAVLAGLGLSQPPLTRRTCALLASGELVRVLPDWQPEDLPMMVLYPRNRHLTAKVRAFADWVAEVFKAEFAAGAGFYA
jgi:LysR family transcriptional regulator for bpeEF and oprC